MTQDKLLLQRIERIEDRLKVIEELLMRKR
jgi:hypothetical protein